MEQTIDVIIRFSKSLLILPIDLYKLWETLINETSSPLDSTEYIKSATLLITSINGEQYLTDDIITFCKNSGFRINAELMSDIYESVTNSNMLLSNIGNFTIKLSPDTIHTLKDSDFNIIYTMSFDTLDDIEDTDIEMVITVNTINSAGKTYKLNLSAFIDGSDCNQYKFYDKQALIINSNMESFMLLRTNPKLTGNIKLVVTEDYKLYLDSFKVSTTSLLNKQEYRHQPVPNEGNYPRDVYKVFGDVPVGELYNVYPDSYDPHKNYFDLNTQIENIYEYGAEYNSDKLYAENMHILAPLYIGKNVPTYFAIFRTDRLFTTNYTEANSTVFNTMLLDATCIKIFDLRNNTTIGKYLNNYKDMISNYLAGSLQLQFLEQDNIDDNTYRQGKNTWKGISVDRGILANKTETSYFATQALESNYPQETYNMFLLNGYARNHMLFPNIINMDFMFNDPDVDEFSIHNYFGLYLTENDFLTFNLVIQDFNNNNQSLTYYDENNKSVKLIDTNLNIVTNSDYADHIFFITTINNAAYVNTLDDANIFFKKYVINKPYLNLTQIEGKLVEFDNDIKSFITIDFTEQIKLGEHLKFACLNNINKDKKQHIVLEIIATNDSRLLNYSNYISPYILTNTPELVTSEFNDKSTKIYRLNFYAMDLNDSSSLASLSDQLKRVEACIAKFDSFLTVSNFDDDTIGIVSTEDNVYFEHILPDNVEDTSILDTVRCFNYNNLIYAYPNSYIPDLYRNEDLPFENTGLELNGNRYVSITKFISTSAYETYYVYEVFKDVYEELKKIPYPLISTEKGYYPIVKHNISECNLVFNEDLTLASNLNVDPNLFNNITNPYDVTCSYIVSQYPIRPYNNMINICTPMAAHVALMGISNIKDIDMYTDRYTSHEYKTENTITFSAGERVYIDNSDYRIRKFTCYKFISGNIKNIPLSSNTSFVFTNNGLLYTCQDISTNSMTIPMHTDYIEFTEDTTIQLLNNARISQYDYTVSDPVLKSDNYYVDPTDTENSKLTIPLVPAVNCQWKSNGTYFDNNSLLNVQNISTYEIVGNFIENEYTPAGNINNQYIINKLSDIVNVSATEYMTIKLMILNNTYPHIIKKFLITNYNLETAIGYYNPYIQTLSFIYYGINFDMKLSNTQYKNEIQLNEFNNFEVYIINNYNAELTNEIFVNKDDEFILIINHGYSINTTYTNNNILSFDLNHNLEVANYDMYKAPYNYDFMNSAVINDIAYVRKNGKSVLSTDAAYIMEYDLPIYNTDVAFDEAPAYIYFSCNEDIFNSYNDYDMIHKNTKYSALPIISKVKPTLSTTDVTYDNELANNMYNLYGITNIDERQKNTYLLKYYQDATTSELTDTQKILTYIDTFANDFDMYIMYNNSEDKLIYKEFNINDNYQPIVLNLSIPKVIKYNQGLFNPNFVDMVSYDINDSISDILDIDTLCANTHIKSIDSIPNYVESKILKDNCSATYNYFIRSLKSPLSSCWDNDIYRLYTADETYTNIKGYTIGFIDKMMFASICMKLTLEQIILSKWNYNIIDNTTDIVIAKNNEHAEVKRQYDIRLNITKTFYNYILNNEVVLNNWNNIDDIINRNTYITNFISLTLLKIFNLKSNFNVEVYAKYDPTLESAMFVMDEPDDYEDFTLCTNMETSFQEINNEIILTMSFVNYDKYKYYPIVKINKI